MKLWELQGNLCDRLNCFIRNFQCETFWAKTFLRPSGMRGSKSLVGRFYLKRAPSHGGALVHCPPWENNRTAWQLPSSANEGNYNCWTTLHAALLWHHPLPSLPFTSWIMSHYKVWLEFSVSQSRQVQKVLSSGCSRVKKVANWEEKLWRALDKCAWLPSWQQPWL